MAIQALARAMSLFALMMGLAASTVSPSLAAMRRCAELIGAAGQHPSDEMAARKEAIVVWTHAAKALGEGYMRWQLANNRSLECARGATGFVCSATGEPCMITQVPGTPATRTPSPLPTPNKQN